MNMNKNKADRKRRNHKANFYPFNQRLAFLVLSIILLVYAIIGVYYDDFMMPGKRGILHLHGYSTWVMLLAFIATAANLLSFFIDHYDKRDNEHKYEKFAAFSKKAGWFFFVAALIVQVSRVFSHS